MKKRWFTIFSLMTAFSGICFAQGGPGENMADMKAKQLEGLNMEKAAVEKAISCVTSSKDQEGFKKCHDEKRSAMQKLHEQHKEQRRKHLQDEIKKLDQEQPKN